MKLKEMLKLIDDQVVVLLIPDKTQGPWNDGCKIYSMISTETKKLKSHPDLSKYLNRKVAHINLGKYYKCEFGIEYFETRLEIIIN